MKRTNHKKQPPRKTRVAGVSKINASTSMDNRLTQASLLLGYTFKYGINFHRRIINLTGEINEDMFDNIDRALTEMEAESKAAITIKINSSGGYCYQAMAIVGRLKESKCQIVTKGYGEVMSAASLILAAGDKRQISRHATFMHHEPSYALDDSRFSSHKDYLEQAAKEMEHWSRLMAEFTNQSSEFWSKQGYRKDAYFSPEELVELGVVDTIF